MENMQINLNTKLEVAVEILATTIALTSRQGFTTKDVKMKQLLKEREEMYKGNSIVIDSIIKKYGPQIKENYEKI